MSLELKIEGMRARGELTAEERDRLVHLLQGPPAKPVQKAVFFTRLRCILLGTLIGVALAYLTWGLFT
jgi:hypothetical protein